jgi:hypothetical protein
VSLCVPKTLSSCCLEGRPMIPWAPWPVWKISKASTTSARGMVLRGVVEEQNVSPDYAMCRRHLFSHSLVTVLPLLIFTAIHNDLVKITGVVVWLEERRGGQRMSAPFEGGRRRQHLPRSAVSRHTHLVYNLAECLWHVDYVFQCMREGRKERRTGDTKPNRL